jgi:hypothetical protein
MHATRIRAIVLIAAIDILTAGSPTPAPVAAQAQTQKVTSSGASTRSPSSGVASSMDSEGYPSRTAS